MKRLKILSTALALALVLTIGIASYSPKPVQAACMSQCYWATFVILKNKDGSGYTGTVYSVGINSDIKYNQHFTNGVMDNLYVWSGYQPYSWIDYSIDVWKTYPGPLWAYGHVSLRHSTVPTTPDVSVATVL